MKNIGIFTFQWFDNYGTVLQAYALQTCLKGLGHNAHIVPLSSNHLKGLRRFMSKTPWGAWQKLMTFLWEGGNRRQNMYNKFRQMHFDYSRSPLSFTEALSTIWSEDVLVWGSDNIWSPWCVWPDDQPMSKVFFGDGIVHKRKLAYAASTGALFERHPKCREVLARIKQAGFEAIGLREMANVGFFRENGIDVVHTPDPSLLMTREMWGAYECDDLVPGSQYVFGYELGHLVKFSVRECCEEIASGQPLKVLIPYPKKFWRDRDVACHPDPFEWIALLSHATYVVTDSFHGVMFSLIFHRPFIFLSAHDEDGRVNMRANEILKKVGLISRVLPENAEKRDLLELMSTPIDWPKVDAILEGFRKEGIEFLKRI